RYLLGMKLESPVVGRRRKRILAIYAAFSIAYSIFFSTLLFILIRKFLIGHLALLGVLISLVLLYGTVRRPLGPLVRTGRLWALDHRGAIRRRQIPLVGAAALSIGAFFLLPVPGQRTLDITLEPARQAAVVVPEDLCLKSTSFAAGQRVSRGQTLAVL